MGTETILAIVACCAIIAAMLMATLAYRMNENLTRHCNRFADLCDQQNNLLKRMNQEWYEAYVKMVTTKAEAAKNEETKEPEQIVCEIFDLLKRLEGCTAKAERPIPIVKDRQGRLAEAATLKDWLQKLNEEVDELKYDVMEAYGLGDVPGGDADYLNAGQKRNIVEELCDVIEVLYSMANQMGIDGDMIQQGIAETNKKLRERGCI